MEPTNEPNETPAAGAPRPSFPVWGIAYAIGAAGIFLTYTAISERRDG